MAEGSIPMSPPPRRVPRAKRTFDLAATVLAAPLWVPVCLLAAMALLITEGRPVFYRSRRRVHGDSVQPVFKFRTMVRNAEQVLNRDTVPVTNTCFLNIPAEHPVYTAVGRRIERWALTELPQLVHVLAGTMSLIGNRPLPVNVVKALLQRYPYAEDRFLAPGGLTGPVQLIGRDFISDEDRLGLEIDYCLLTTLRYSVRIDLAVLLATVLVALRVRAPFSVDEVRAMLHRAAAPRRLLAPGAEDRRRSGARFELGSACTLGGVELGMELREISYRGLGVIFDSPVKVGEWVNLPCSSGGQLRACVRWLRLRPDGRFEGGLSLAPVQHGAASLLKLLDKPEESARIATDSPAEPEGAEPGLPLPR